MINRILNECSKLAPRECKTKHDWVGKVIHWETCKRLNLTILPNDICTNQNPSLIIWCIKIPWNFDVQTHYLIPTWRPVLIKKKKVLVIYRIFPFLIVKIKEGEIQAKYLNWAKELKMLWSMRVTVIPIVIGAFGMVPKGLERGLKK